MARKKISKEKISKELSTKLRKGDPVMIIAGGNSQKGKIIKGETGKVLKFLPKKNRVVVEGLNIVKRHKKAQSANDSSGIIDKEGSVHISNVMYFNEELSRPVRIKFRLLEDARKVRGYIHPTTGEFEQIDV